MSSSGLLEWYRLVCADLTPIYGNTEAVALARILTERITGLKPHLALLNANLTLSLDQIDQLNYYVSQLKLQKPIQYILGESEFFGINFFVNQHVLIPRPETEELVAWILDSNRMVSPSIIDIGSGSGCIAISLAANIKSAKVVCLDVSEEAIAVATQNAQSAGVSMLFAKESILNEGLEVNAQKFDIVVSNPPYVRHGEKVNMSPNVLDYEPHLALFVPDSDPLVFYRAICSFAVRNLNPNGFIYFEINEALGPEMKNLMETFGFVNVEIKPDINGKDRMARGQLAAR